MTATSSNVIALAVGGILIGGCAAPAEPPPQPAAQATAATPRSAVSINAEMVSLVDHAGHALWDAEKEEMAPKTDNDWADIEHHATQLAAAGALVQLGGAGVNDLVWAASPVWQKWAQGMADAGLAAIKAAQSRNMDALVVANGQLVESCEGCHKEFKPDLPSEGLTHAHAH